jgi:hypothetical protein
MYPWALGSLSAASYDSRGYGRGILSCIDTRITQTEVDVEVNLRPTDSPPVCLGIGLPSGAHDQIFLYCLTVADFFIWGTLSDERMSLKFTRTNASEPCQSSHSRVQDPHSS